MRFVFYITYEFSIKEGIFVACSPPKKYNDRDYFLFTILFALCTKNAFMDIWALPWN
jgi:hypothetical protein